MAETALNQWAAGSCGTAKIRLFLNEAGLIEVYALDGHNLLPLTRTFPNTADGEADARLYANSLWKAL
jgi:hypothetical protein